MLIRLVLNGAEWGGGEGEEGEWGGGMCGGGGGWKESDGRPPL